MQGMNMMSLIFFLIIVNQNETNNMNDKVREIIEKQ